MLGLNQFSFLLSSMVQKDPNFIIKFFADLLGAVINLIYNFLSIFMTSNTLGFSIIILTILTRLIMLPLSIKSHKSMQKMSSLNPEIEKIRKKYGDTKDPEAQNKMNQEINTLYAKEGASPFSGCLPMLLQLPIFFALTYIMNQSYLYIDKLKDLYVNKLAAPISNTIQDVGNGLGPIIAPFINSKLPKNNSIKLDILQPGDLAKALNKFTKTDWIDFIKKIPEQYSGVAKSLTENLLVKSSIDNFLGLDITRNAGLSFPGIIIPILTVITTFLTSYISMKQQDKSKTTVDDTAQATQKSMLYIMPFFMGFTVINTPIGVGIYWIAGNVALIIQQIILEKFFSDKKLKKENDK